MTKRVLMVIKTSELEYDDRLRKETQTLIRAGYHVSIACSLSSNQSIKGNCFGGATFNSFFLRSRKLLRGNTLSSVQMIEFGFKVWSSGLLARCDLVVIHDPIAMVLLPWVKFARVPQIVWDQHELPPERILNSRILGSMFGWFCNSVDVVIQTNEQRLGVLRQKCGFKGVSKVLHNYVDHDFLSLPRAKLRDDERDWLAGRPYVLLQSGGYPWRNFESVIDASFASGWPDELQVIVVGNTHSATVELLKRKYPDLMQKVLFTGMVPQMELVRFIDSALVSIVLYRDNVLNQKYCEANRLYQALSRGCPVIVGCNPTMKAVVESHGVGVVLDDDGRSPTGILQAIIKVRNSHDYATFAKKYRSFFSWGNQEDVLKEAVSLR